MLLIGQQKTVEFISRERHPVSNNFETYLKKIRKIIISNSILNLCLQIIEVNETTICFILILVERNRFIESDEAMTLLIMGNLRSSWESINDYRHYYFIAKSTIKNQNQYNLFSDYTIFIIEQTERHNKIWWSQFFWGASFIEMLGRCLNVFLTENTLYGGYPEDNVRILTSIKDADVDEFSPRRVAMSMYHCASG